MSPLTMVIWLFPVAFLVHDGEEILTVERWAKAEGPVLQRRFGRRRWAAGLLGRAGEVTTARFSTIVACLFLAICAVGALATRGLYWPFAAALAVFFGHVLTHVGQSLFFGGYTPGVVTAVLVTLPYSLWAYGRLFNVAAITWPMAWLGLPIGLGAVGLIFALGAALGWRLFRHDPEDS